MSSQVLALLELLLSLIDYGFCNYQDVCDKMLPCLIGMLDGRDDVSRDVVAPEAAPPSRFEVHVKSLFDTQVLMDSKVVCCRIMQKLYTMQLDVKLSLLLQDYKEEWGEAGGATRTCGVSPAAHRPHGKREERFKEIVTPKWRSDVTPVLVDLTRYEYKPLVRSALGLLVRHFEQRRELHAAAEKVQLLIQVHLAHHQASTRLPCHA